ELRPAPRTLAKLTVMVDAERKAKRDKPNGAHANGHAHIGHAHHTTTDDFFPNIKAAALANLDRWVPALHPTASKYPNLSWRVSPADLGRPDLEEDLSYHPTGISDFGEERGLTPVDAVLRFGDVADAKAAAFWLCRQLGVAASSLGWKGRAQEIAPRSI